MTTVETTRLNRPVYVCFSVPVFVRIALDELILTCLKNAGHTGSAALFRLTSFKGKARALLSQQRAPRKRAACTAPEHVPEDTRTDTVPCPTSQFSYPVQILPESLTNQVVLNSELAVVALPEEIDTTGNDSLDSSESHGMTRLASESGDAKNGGYIGDLDRRRALWLSDQSKGQGSVLSANTNARGQSEVAPVVLVDSFQAKVECFRRAVGLASLLACTDGILLAPGGVSS